MASIHVECMRVQRRVGNIKMNTTHFPVYKKQHNERIFFSTLRRESPAEEESNIIVSKLI